MQAWEVDYYSRLFDSKEYVETQFQLEKPWRGSRFVRKSDIPHEILDMIHPKHGEKYFTNRLVHKWISDVSNWTEKELPPKDNIYVLELSYEVWSPALF